MSFLKDLLNAGVDYTDAQVLESNYANEPEFIDGLELVARALALNQPVGLVPPSGEPWRMFHSQMVHCSDQQQAFMAAIGSLDTTLQVAISGAVSTRMAQLSQFAQAQQVNLGKHKKTADYIRILSNLGYTFKYNLCTHDVEVNGEKMTDLMRSTIRNRVRDLGIKEVWVVEDAYFEEAGKNRYHPIREYLTSLSFQGGDPISELADYFVDEHSVFANWLRRWLIGACARIMANEQNRMLVLDGRQGLGKDYFAKWLASPLPEYFYEGPILPDEKDHRLRLMSTWIWNVNELGSTTRRSDREALKAFLTVQTVRERKAYGHFDVQGPSLSNFIGTVNNEGGILNDPTGHRRFMIAHLTSIDWSYTKLDVDQVWAQAFELYLSGESWQLTGAELDAASAINDEYQVTDLVEEAIKELFIIDPNDLTLWMSTWEIMDIMKAENSAYSMIRGGNLKPGAEIDTRRLASALTKLGLTKSDPKGDSTGRRRRGYFGIKRR